MKNLKNIVITAITTQMIRNEKGEIIDKYLHSDLINAVNEAFALCNIVECSESQLAEKDKELQYCHKRMGEAYSEISKLQSELTELKEKRYRDIQAIENDNKRGFK